MYWQQPDEDDPQQFSVPERVIDLHFRIECPALPVDHGWLLFSALRSHLPWLEQEPGAGIHPIHTAESGNGWSRPEQRGALLYPSRRTPLVLRLPRSRLHEAQQLRGTTLTLGDFSLTLGQATVRPLHKSRTLHARHLGYPDADNEAHFLEQAVNELRSLDIGFKKVLCGRDHTLRNGEQELATRSLMVADLTLSDAVRLQEHGLGPFRHLGCGLFIAHKAV